jgi:hypothetical protein
MTLGTKPSLLHGHRLAQIAILGYGGIIAAAPFDLPSGNLSGIMQVNADAGKKH